MKKIFLISLILLVQLSFAQKTILLKSCLENAQIHHPLMQQKALNTEKSSLNNEQYRKDLFPQFSVTAKATYQNEVISLPIDMPLLDIPEISKDQYRMSMDINQAIYRGGLYQKQKSLEELNSLLDQLEVDRDLYLVKNQVKDLFISVILLDKQKKITQTYIRRLNVKKKEMKAQIEEGMILNAALDRINIELLKAAQQLDENDIKRQSLIENLELLTAMDLSGIVELMVVPPIIQNEAHQRLEYQLLTQTQEKLDFSKNLIDIRKYPHLFAFAQGGIGRPGFNYLSDDFSEFWMIGVQLQWKVFNWNKNNNDKKLLNVQIQKIENQKQDFDRQITIALTAMKADISNWEKQLEKDPEIIKLRKSVADNAGHQLNQGLITTSAYVDEMQNLSQSELEMKIHEVQLINSQLNYLNILGKL